jgi:hypothetical protein
VGIDFWQLIMGRENGMDWEMSEMCSNGEISFSRHRSRIFNFSFFNIVEKAGVGICEINYKDLDGVKLLFRSKKEGHILSLDEAKLICEKEYANFFDL